jgi:LytS/YehU family sensor histidine kinase
MRMDWTDARSVVAPLLLVIGLAAVDRWSNDSLSVSGVACGMALMAALTFGLSRRAGLHPAQGLRPALQAALVSVAESSIGVVLVFLLAAPMTVLLPMPWVMTLLVNERAADLMVTLLIGAMLLVATRALRRAQRQASARMEAERDAAMARATLAERDRELVRAELQLLRAQVEPHFLWNSLANVEYLLRKDPGQARQMLAQLIVYLRSTLTTAQGTATLGSEFESVRAYLGLMRFRMGERLAFDLELAPDLANEDFPPLVLQTLVENAIKHGLEPKQGAATLCIAARRCSGDEPRIHIEVVDNGVGLQANPATRGTRLGLNNVRDRLRALHGGRASLSITGLDTGGVRASIEWPLGKATA